MTTTIERIGRFIHAGAAAQSAVDRAIARAELVALIARRRRELEAMRLKRDDDVTDALLRLAMAETHLADFDLRQAMRFDQEGRAS